MRLALLVAWVVVAACSSSHRHETDADAGSEDADAEVDSEDADAEVDSGDADAEVDSGDAEVDARDADPDGVRPSYEVAYVNELSSRGIPVGEAITHLGVVINVGAVPIEMDSIVVAWARTDHPDVEFDCSARSDRVLLQPGEAIGRLSPAAEELLIGEVVTEPWTDASLEIAFHRSNDAFVVGDVVGTCLVYLAGAPVTLTATIHLHDGPLDVTLDGATRHPQD